MVADDPVIHAADVLDRLRNPTLESASFVAPALEPDFWGRADERSRVREVLQAFGGSDTKLIVVTGERGIGKSRLLQAVASNAQAMGWAVCDGQCASFARAHWVER